MTMTSRPLARARRLFAACFLAGTAAIAVLPATAQQPAVPNRAAIETIVREYLIANPEVIQEALQELERRQQEAQKSAQLNAVKAEKARLLESPHNAVAGNPSGDITIVEFFDYNCGYCKRALQDVEALVKADPKLRVVLKDFPVLGPDSVEASMVAVAARAQLKGDKVFEYHRRLMESRGRVNKDRALAVAKEMGLDLARLQKDMEAPAVRAALQEAVELGDKLGLTGTPAFVIGDEVVFGAVGEASLRNTVASVRKCGKALC